MTFLQWLFTPSSEIQRTKDLTDQAVAWEQHRADLGLESEEEKQARINRILISGDEQLNYKIPALDPQAGFEQGLQEGASNIKGAVGASINGISAMIPWQVWAILGVIAVFLVLPHIPTSK